MIKDGSSPIGILQCECGGDQFNIRYTKMIVLTMPPMDETKYQAICTKCNKWHNL